MSVQARSISSRTSDALKRMNCHTLHRISVSVAPEDRFATNFSLPVDDELVNVARLSMRLMLAMYKRTRPQSQDEPDITGTYRCEGVLLDGNKYKATVEIQKIGDAYTVRWVRGIAEAHIGVGIRKGNLLSVCFAAGRGGAGIVVYQIDKGPKLHGDWTELGGIGIMQTETLIREK